MSGIPKSPNRLAVSTASCVLLGVLVGCASRDQVYLPALKADPMASYSHADLDPDGRVEIPKHSVRPGSSREARVSRSWLVGDGADVEAKISDLLLEAEKAGWAFDTFEPAPSDDGDTRWRANKYMKEGLANLTVRLDPSSWRGGVDVSMQLYFVEEDAATPLLVVERNAEYESLATMRDAIEASGVRCTRFTSEVPNEFTYGPGVSMSCNENVTMRLFDTHEEMQAYQQESVDSDESTRRADLIGPNWMLDLGKNVELGDYLQDELGGELVVAEDGT